MYADVTTQDGSDKCFDVSEYKLHRGLINTLEWVNKIKFAINFEKTQCMVICTRQRLGNCRNVCIQFERVAFVNVSCSKLVWFYIDKCPTWSEHIDILSKKKEKKKEKVQVK